jgi:hypothetical protein
VVESFAYTCLLINVFYICTFIFLFILGTSECPLLGRDHYDRQKTNCSSSVVLTGSLHGEILPLPIQKNSPNLSKTSNFLPHFHTLRWLFPNTSLTCTKPRLYSIVLQAQCAKKWVHDLVPLVSNPADSPLIRNLVEASKRSQHASRSKKEPISLLLYQRLLISTQNRTATSTIFVPHSYSL